LIFSAQVRHNDVLLSKSRVCAIFPQEHHLHLSHIKIENYRAHSKTEIPLPQLGCFIGENNAGKSTVLHAIRFVLEEKKLSTDDFRNPELPVTVTLQFEGICAEDLKRVSLSLSTNIYSRGYE
jgi:predicted ATPase